MALYAFKKDENTTTSVAQNSISGSYSVYQKKQISYNYVNGTRTKTGEHTSAYSIKNEYIFISKDSVSVKSDNNGTIKFEGNEIEPSSYLLSNSKLIITFNGIKDTSFYTNVSNSEFTTQIKGLIYGYDQNGNAMFGGDVTSYFKKN